MHINETSFSPVDLMPYGDNKNSGFGREGPRYAGEELTTNGSSRSTPKTAGRRARPKERTPA